MWIFWALIWAQIWAQLTSAAHTLKMSAELSGAQILKMSAELSAAHFLVSALKVCTKVNHFKKIGVVNFCYTLKIDLLTY